MVAAGSRRRGNSSMKTDVYRGCLEENTAMQKNRNKWLQKVLKDTETDAALGKNERLKAAFTNNLNEIKTEGNGGKCT